MQNYQKIHTISRRTREKCKEKLQEIFRIIPRKEAEFFKNVVYHELCVLQFQAEQMLDTVADLADSSEAARIATQSLLDEVASSKSVIVGGSP